MTPQEIRQWLQEEHPRADVENVEVDTSRDEPVVRIFARRPGLLIGKRASTIESIRGSLARHYAGVKVDIVEFR